MASGCQVFDPPRCFGQLLAFAREDAVDVVVLEAHAAGDEIGLGEGRKLPFTIRGPSEQGEARLGHCLCIAKLFLIQSIEATMKPLTFFATVTLVLGFAFTVATATSRGRTQVGPLSLAAGRGDLALVTSILASGLSPNTPDGPRRSRPLATASRQSRLDVMTVLLTAGADPNLRDAGGNLWVPLMHAIHKHQPEAVRFLLEHGAQPDGPPELTFTPLMMAVASGQTESVSMLLDRGANPRRVAPDGVTLLTLAVSGGALTDIDEPLLGACHTETVKLLRTRVPDLGLDRSWRGQLATFFARLNGCRDVLRLVNVT